jgi:uncharacterized membrane protein
MNILNIRYNIRRLFIIVVCSFFLTSLAHALTYKVIILHPQDFYGSIAVGINASQQVGVGYFSDELLDYHALLWSGSAESFIDLNPSGFQNSEAVDTSGTQQIGYGYKSDKGHALLWNGSADNYIDLTPPDFNETFGLAISDDSQVGFGSGTATGGQMHALLWKNGDPNDYVDLNPAGFEYSVADGVSGSQQVGSGGAPGFEWHVQHALLWNGTAESFVDLNPDVYVESSALGTNGTQQVGSGQEEGFLYPPESPPPTRALLWNSTAQSVVDLTPGGFTRAVAYGINATHQVGYGKGETTGDYGHALLWNGSAESVIDLHQFLPAEFAGWGSVARSIDSNGNIVGYVHRNLYPAIDINTIAVMWQPVTESVTIKVKVDIKPWSCRNPVNVRSHGVLPVAILGTEDLDVTTIDTASIRLAGVAPIRSDYKDVGSPKNDAKKCACASARKDGLIDLTLKFDTQKIVQAIGEVSRGDIVTLELTGTLNDGTPVEGADTVLILKPNFKKIGCPKKNVLHKSSCRNHLFYPPLIPKFR